jgi:hypothetical protein
MILAAFLSFFAVVLKVILALGSGEMVASGERCGGKGRPTQDYREGKL